MQRHKEQIPTPQPSARGLLTVLTGGLVIGGLLLLGLVLSTVLQPPAPAAAVVQGVQQQDPTPPPALTPPAYSIVVDPLVADSAMLELGISAYDPAHLPTADTPLSMYRDLQISGPVEVTVNGRALPLLTDGGAAWISSEQGGRLVSGRQISFDPQLLNSAASELDLHLIATLTIQPSNPDLISYPPGMPRPTAPPDALPPYPPVTVKIDRMLHVSFDRRQRIATPDLTVAGRGGSLTLLRVVATASKVRFYLRPEHSGMQLGLLQGYIDLSADNNGLNSNLRSVNGLHMEGTELVGEVETNLLDKPSPWLLTFPEMPTQMNADPNDPQSWVGPWIFYFAMPDAATGLTPGPLPTLPAATPRPTLIPAAVPTHEGPLSGPVAATETPFVDLDGLVHQADVIVRMHTNEVDSASMQRGIFGGAVLEWLKGPAELQPDHLDFTTGDPFAEASPLMQSLRSGVSLNDFVVFLRERETQPDTGVSPYVLADPTNGSFAVRDGKIASSDSRYAGMPIADFLREIRGLLGTP